MFPAWLRVRLAPTLSLASGNRALIITGTQFRFPRDPVITHASMLGPCASPVKGSHLLDPAWVYSATPGAAHGGGAQGANHHEALRRGRVAQL